MPQFFFSLILLHCTVQRASFYTKFQRQSTQDIETAQKFAVRLGKLTEQIAAWNNIVQGRNLSYLLQSNTWGQLKISQG